VPDRLEITRRKVTDADVDLLVAWHADPDTLPYWDYEEHTPKSMREHLAEPDFIPWLVLEDGEPVGYLQHWWKPGSSSAGLDGFLIPSARGRGIMPAAARQLALDLLADRFDEVTVDPYIWNERAVRGWSKAGFVEVDRRPADKDHTADWVLMRFVRD
jgi:aminoglycoside 6'-N-acetyltransferase